MAIIRKARVQIASRTNVVPTLPVYNVTNSLQFRVVTNLKSQVVPDFDIRWKKGFPHKTSGLYKVEKRWPGAATGGPRPALQGVMATLEFYRKSEFQWHHILTSWFTD